MLLRIYTCLLLSIITIDSLGAQHKEYYAGVVGIISPFLGYQGKGSLSKEQALKMNHYLFEYDDESRIERISFFRCGRKSNESYYRTHQVTFQYKGDSIIRSYFDATANKSTLWRHYYGPGEIHQEVFSKERDSVVLTFFNLKGERISAGEAYFYKFTNIDEKSFIQEQLEVDGTAVVLTSYFPFEKSLITKDENGHLFQIINIDPETNKKVDHPKVKYAEVVFQFDKVGTEIQWDFRDATGQLVDRGADEMDPGYAVWTNDFEWYDQSIGHYKSATKRLLDKNKALVSDEFGVYYTKYTFDSHGTYTSSSFLDEKMNAMDHPEYGYAMHQVIVKDGLKLSDKFLNASGNPKQDGVAAREFVYDATGNLLKTIEYDSESNVIE